jgi:hypothetical protein
VAEPRLPIAASFRVVPEPGEGTGQQPVEVHLAADGEQVVVGGHDLGQGSGQRSTRGATLEDGGRHDPVEALGSGQLDIDADGGLDAPSHLAEEREPVRDEPWRTRPRQHDLPGEGMQGPDLRPIQPRRHSQPPRDALGELGRRVSVEGHDEDPRRRAAAIGEDRDPRHEGRRLPAAGRGDDLRRAVPERGRPSLPVVEAAEDLGDRGGHPATVRLGAYRAVTDPFRRARP